MSSAYHDGSMRLPPYTDAEKREIKGAIVARFRADLSKIGPETGAEEVKAFYSPVYHFPELAQELRAKLMEKGRPDLWIAFEAYRQGVKDQEEETLRDAAEWLKSREGARTEWNMSDSQTKSARSLLQKLKQLNAAGSSQSKTA